MAQEVQDISFEALENVEIRPEELRLIGRYVSLTFQEKKWVGLVYLISKDTVVLINALSMTMAYFEGPYRSKDEKNKPSTSSRQPSSTPAAGSGGAAGSNEVTPTSADPFSHDRPSDNPIIDEEEKPKLVPFASFNRKDLVNVQFATDHTQLHHSLTQKFHLHGVECPNEQFLRVYVRRYIVHTAQGNNPHKIDMADFVRSRTKWQKADAKVLETVATEEVKLLIQIENDIEAKRERIRQARAQRHGQQHVGGGAGGAAIRGRMDGGRDMLYTVNVPSRTSYVAIAHLALSITGILYAASAFSTADDNLVKGFIGGLTWWVISAACVLVLCGAASGYHGLNMTFPIEFKLPLIIRVFLMFCTTGLLLSATIAVSIVQFGHHDPISGRSLEEYYTTQFATSQASICGYASKFRCSGFSTSCKTNSGQSLCISSCASTLIQLGLSCESSLKSEIQSALLPVCIIFYIAMLALCFDWWMLQRFYHFVSLFAAAMGTTLTGEPLPPARQTNNNNNQNGGGNNNNSNAPTG